MGDDIAEKEAPTDKTFEQVREEIKQALDKAIDANDNTAIDAFTDVVAERLLYAQDIVNVQQPDLGAAGHSKIANRMVQLQTAIAKKSQDLNYRTFRDFWLNLERELEQAYGQIPGKNNPEAVKQKQFAKAQKIADVWQGVKVELLLKT